MTAAQAPALLLLDGDPGRAHGPGGGGDGVRRLSGVLGARTGGVEISARLGNKVDYAQSNTHVSKKLKNRLRDPTL